MGPAARTTPRLSTYAQPVPSAPSASSATAAEPAGQGGSPRGRGRRRRARRSRRGAGRRTAPPRSRCGRRRSAACRRTWRRSRRSTRRQARVPVMVPPATPRHPEDTQHAREPDQQAGDPARGDPLGRHEQRDEQQGHQRGGRVEQPGQDRVDVLLAVGQQHERRGVASTATTAACPQVDRSRGSGVRVRTQIATSVAARRRTGRRRPRAARRRPPARS